jgi:NAD dependent epimerase/dehydratase family enzyme
VRNATFARELGAALRRPALLRLPAAPLRFAAGDLADELLLGGQRVVPEKALKAGFVFRHANLRAALAAILGGKTSDTIDMRHAMPHLPAAAEK